MNKKNNSKLELVETDKTSEVDKLSKTLKHLSVTTTLKPLVKWSGGKSDEISLFEKYLPSPKDYDTYIEPFIGAGALYFHLNYQCKEKLNVINDVHTELIHFYKTIKYDYVNYVYNFMQRNPNDEETYYKVRGMTIDDFVDDASRFYYLRKTCFRGMLRYNSSGEFNIPFGRYKTINYDNLLNNEYVKLLKNTKIYSKDFEVIFKKYNNERNFMFLDPPYDSEFTDYGYCTFDKKDHKRLAKYFKKTKNKCLMIIGKTEFIEDLYENYIIDEYDKQYKFKLYSGRIGNEINNKHLIIKNY